MDPTLKMIFGGLLTLGGFSLSIPAVLISFTGIGACIGVPAFLFGLLLIIPGLLLLQSGWIHRAVKGEQEAAARELADRSAIEAANQTDDDNWSQGR